MVYFMVVKVDGACRNNGRRGPVGGAGAVASRLRLEEHKSLNTTRFGGRPHTSQRAELLAILLGISLAVRRRDELDNSPFMLVTVLADSKYAVECMTIYRKRWLDNDFRKSNGAPVANRDMLEACYESLDDFKHGKIRFRHILRDDNDDADRLANLACDEAEDTSNYCYLTDCRA